MKIILDPHLFALPTAGAAKADFQSRLNEIKLALDQLNCIIREHRANVTLGRGEWHAFRLTYITPLLKATSDPMIATAWRFIERSYVPSDLPIVNQITSWGTRQLLHGDLMAGREWADIVSEAVICWVQRNESVVFFQRLMVGRNLTEIGTGYSILKVKARWALYFATRGLQGPSRTNCVSSLRNVNVPWTSRYDDRLPDTCPNGGLAFTPPADWHKGRVPSHGTIQGKATWLDQGGNGWAKPTPPNAAHHWDVYLREPAVMARFPVNPINITCWGTNDRNRQAGEVHHYQAAQKHLTGGRV